MTATSQAVKRRLRYHPDAYRFIFEALQHTQQKLNRPVVQGPEDEEAHITGQELAVGARELGLQRYGLLAKTVFHHWGVKSTADFGRMVFELIERGEMRKTERDQLSDFVNVYDFEDSLDRDYDLSTSDAFKK